VDHLVHHCANLVRSTPGLQIDRDRKSRPGQVRSEQSRVYDADAPRRKNCQCRVLNCRGIVDPHRIMVQLVEIGLSAKPGLLMLRLQAC